MSWWMKLLGIDKLIAQAKAEGYALRNQELEETRQRIDEFALETTLAIGNRIITITNEWEDNLGVGRITGHFQNAGGSTLVEYFDELTERTMVSFAAVLPYRKETVEALVKLAPWERHALVYGKSLSSEDGYLFDKRKTYDDSPAQSPITQKELEAKLKDKGYGY